MLSLYSVLLSFCLSSVIVHRYFANNLSSLLALNFVILGLSTLGKITNIYFIFLISFFWSLIVLSRSIASQKGELPFSIVVATLFINLGGFLLINNNSSFYLLVFGFELIMLSSLFLLKYLAKSERVLEAFFEMYMWGIVGSFLLVLSIVLRVLVDLSFLGLNTFCCITTILGFSIKVPLWPFTSWLLKAHVEASTEFSIFLSGFLVKFGILGIYYTTLFMSNSPINLVLSSLSLIGIMDALLKLSFQVDLKRIVALTTVIEANWMFFCLLSGSRFLIELGYLLILVHCLTTTVEFYIVEYIYRRFKTRNFLRINNIYNLYPLLNKFLLLSTIVIIGLPGTTVFTLKFLFFTSLYQVSITYFILFLVIFMLIMPIIFIKIFISLRGGLTTNRLGKKTRDLTSTELSLILIPLTLSLLGGPLLYLFI